MKSENKKDFKISGIILIILGAIPVISAFFAAPLISAILNLTGRFIIIIGVILLFIGINEN